MPKGPRGEKRPADVIGCAVTVARIATGEGEDTAYTVPARAKSGRAGAMARSETLTAAERAGIARKAAKARWHERESDEMNATGSSFDQRFESAFQAGLSDVKFFVRRSDGISVDALKQEALEFQEAIDQGKFTPVDSVD